MNAYEKNPSHALQLHENNVTEKLVLLKDEKKPLLHHSMLAQGLEEEFKKDKDLTMQVRTFQTLKVALIHHFTLISFQFREQVVKETVERLEQKLYEKLVHCSQPAEFCESSFPAAAAPAESPLGSSSSSSSSRQCDWLMSCCSCHARIVGVRYQCRYRGWERETLWGLDAAGFYFRGNKKWKRLQKQMDKRFLKAEKQRLRAEKKQRKAEVRELKKQLKLHRKIHLWNSIHVLETNGSPALKSESVQPNTFLPNQPFQAIVPTLSAVFVDENLPDGTHLKPGTKFIKHWRMKNTGNVEWSSDTKLKLMWGNLTLASAEKKDVIVPSLPSGQVGTVSVEFVAPNIEGTYTSHWRLSHRGEQFGPRIWCSIVVDPSPAADCVEGDWKDSGSCEKTGAQLIGEIAEQTEISLPTVPLKIKNLPSEREFYIPSVDLLTAQDLLSFELLDINIVQELERVPHNTPVDMTPCMSPLPRDSPLLEKPGLGQIEEENEGKGCLSVDSSVVKVKAEHALNQEEGEEDMSGTQFVCETVIRSLTLDAAPDHKPPQKNPKILQKSPVINSNSTSKKEATIHHAAGNGDEEEDDRDDVQSQCSSASSEDYIIILPECFDTSRPLGDSMYSSALSQPGLEKAGEPETAAEIPEGGNQAQIQRVSDPLTASQTLAAVPLTPATVDSLPQKSLIRHLGKSSVDFMLPIIWREASLLKQLLVLHRYPQGSSIAGELVKGALSVAASAYKALFAGPPIMEQPAAPEEQTAALLSSLCEMGFCDRQLNLRLLKKHNNNMIEVVTELLQISNRDWCSRC
uniref:UBA domain-containing protein n=1 Tax=Zonotrichia albicollis TaxID=44394 RepID=A0A8D2MDK1_ZONAL